MVRIEKCVDGSFDVFSNDQLVARIWKSYIRGRGYRISGQIEGFESTYAYTLKLAKEQVIYILKEMEAEQESQDRIAIISAVRRSFNWLHDTFGEYPADAIDSKSYYANIDMLRRLGWRQEHIIDSVCPRVWSF